MLHINRITFILMAVILFTCSSVSASVIFEDNFNSWPTGYSLYDNAADPPAPWGNGAFTGVYLPTTCNSVARPYVGGAGINATGGPDGSKALEMPRCSSVTNGYYGLPVLMIEDIGTYNELYFRWYVKIDDGMDKAIVDGYKFLDRILVTDGSNIEYIHISLHGSEMSSAPLSMYTDLGYFYDNWFNSNSELAQSGDFNDGVWHVFEVNIKLHSTEGRVRFWLDGNLTVDRNNIQTASNNSFHFQQLNFGLGNVSDTSWYNTTWKSQWFDELVISTTYVGPMDGGSGTTAPGGMRVSAGAMRVGAGSMRVTPVQ